MSFVKVLENSLVKTLAYFDLFNFPLIEEELFKFLWMPPHLRQGFGGQTRMGFEEFGKLASELARPLPTLSFAKERGDSLSPSQRREREERSRTIGWRDSYYFLPGREEIISTRQKGAKETERKLIKARRAVKLIRSVPFLRAVFVCNSVGARMARPESDIDFFIVAEKNRIWIVRFFTNVILRLFGMRTYGSHQANRVCLSFYVDVAHLDLTPWRAVDEDIHFAYWMHQMIPLYDPENYYEKFLKANTWVEKFLPNVFMSTSETPPCPPLKRGGCGDSSPPFKEGTGGEVSGMVGDSRLGRIWKKMWEAMWWGSYGNIIESEAKKLQMIKMKLSTKEKAKLPDHGVVITDGVIKLHENDARRVVRDSWLKKIERL